MVVLNQKDVLASAHNWTNTKALIEAEDSPHMSAKLTRLSQVVTDGSQENHLSQKSQTTLMSANKRSSTRLEERELLRLYDSSEPEFAESVQGALIPNI